MNFSHKGFTLIEIMVAISVITIGVVGIYSLAPKVISITFANFDKFVASQLSQEGIEMVRNIRDTNLLNWSSWDSGLTSCLEPIGCEIDYDDSSLQYYQGRLLKINSSGFYNYENGQNTKFKRKIIIIQNGDILNLKTQIILPSNEVIFEVQENLYNWR